MITINELKYTPEDLDLTRFEDGLYTFTFTVLNGEVEEEFTYQVFLTCKIRLCIDKLLTSLDLKEAGCNCKSDKVKLAFYLDDLYRSLQSAILIGDFNKATCMLNTMQKLCKSDCFECKPCK